MMNTNKRDLYAHVDTVRKRLGIFSYSTPINSLELCKRMTPHIDIIYHDFDTSGFCGAAFAGNKVNTVILNSIRSETEQNFDCGHELIHLVRHIDNDNKGVFNCNVKNKNSYLEWEANEGSAQLLVPYQDFIPRFILLLNNHTVGIQRILAEHYHVTEQVINIRMNSLAYEMDQYQKGIALDRLELLSRTQCKKRGIKPTRYEALCYLPPSMRMKYRAQVRV